MKNPWIDHLMLLSPKISCLFLIMNHEKQLTVIFRDPEDFDSNHSWWFYSGIFFSQPLVLLPFGRVPLSVGNLSKRLRMVSWKHYQPPWEPTGILHFGGIMTYIYIYIFRAYNLKPSFFMCFGVQKHCLSRKMPIFLGRVEPLDPYCSGIKASEI